VLLSLETLETLDTLETALEMLEIESRLIYPTLQACCVALFGTKKTETSKASWLGGQQHETPFATE